MSESHVKQVIVMRTDLNMRKGKMISQGAHASMKVFFDRMSASDSGGRVLDSTNGPLQKFTSKAWDWEGAVLPWMTGQFTKVCLQVNSEQKLIDIYDAAHAEGLPVALIEDSGKTEFHGVVTPTCLAIGPASAEAIDKITGNLKLL